MKKIFKKKYDQGLPAEALAEVGQTLLEILLAFSVLILVLSAIVVGISTSLSNTQYTKNQNLANSYAQEGMAVVRQIRDSSWNSISSLSDYSTNTKYCIGPGLILTQLTSLNCLTQSPVPAGGIFSREVRFEHNSSDCSAGTPSTPTPTPTPPPPGSIPIFTKVTVIVSWSDNKCPSGDNIYCHKVELVSCFSNIDQKQAP